MKTNTTTTDRLVQASRQTLAGDPADCFKAVGLDHLEALTFVNAWLAELAEQAAELQDPPTGDEFFREAGLGLLLVGIQLGRTQS